MPLSPGRATEEIIVRVFNWRMNYFQGLDAITEAYLASACDHFVGTLSSNLGRLILEIRSVLFPRTTTWSLDQSYQLVP